MERTLQPNSRCCFVCGLENTAGLKLRFYETTPGEVSARYVPPPRFQGYPGVLHGGIVAAMLDEASARAHMGGDPPRFLYTAKLEIRYRKAVPIGKELTLSGRSRGSRGKTATAWAGLYDDSGTLLAEADALLVDAPDLPSDSASIDALGWRVYPESSAT